MAGAERVLESPGHEKRLAALRRRFRKAGFGDRRRRPLTLVLPPAWLVFVTLVALIAGLFVWALTSYARKFGSWDLAWRHMASWNNCDAARRVGLAPAPRGYAGYWESHDRDGDGIACEPYRES
jgi:Excalibur calcium-binding domain